MKEDGNMAQAEIYFRQAIALVDSGLSEKNRYVASSFLILGDFLCDQGECEEGFALLKKGLALREEVMAPTSPHIATAQRMVAEVLLDREKGHRLIPCCN